MTPRSAWTPPPSIPARSTLATATWALRQIRAVAPWALLALVAITLIQGLIPAGLALALRELINETVGLLRDGAREASPLVPWLSLVLGLALVDAIATLLADYLNSRIADDLNLRVTDRILSHAWTLDLASFEDPERQDLIARTQGNI